MKIKLLPFVFCVLFVSFASNAKAGMIADPVKADSCCAPDSLKVMSNSYPQFCVSWYFAADSNCRTPYGFEIQWRHFATLDPWNTAVKVYTGGTTVVFCARPDTCRQFEWRVRTICDTLNGGTYSNWVSGPRFGVKCPSPSPVTKSNGTAANDKSAAFERTGVNPNAIKPKEQD